MGFIRRLMPLIEGLRAAGIAPAEPAALPLQATAAAASPPGVASSDVPGARPQGQPAQPSPPIQPAQQTPPAQQPAQSSQADPIPPIKQPAQPAQSAGCSLPQGVPAQAAPAEDSQAGATNSLLLHVLEHSTQCTRFVQLNH